MLSIIMLILYANVGLSQLLCTWVDDATGIALDLRAFSDRNLTAFDNDTHQYLYTPCRNGVKCAGNDVMVSQLYDEPRCYIIGRWDQSIQPEYSNIDGVDHWTFVYPNGDDDCGNPQREWSPTFICDPHTDVEIGTVNEIPYCFYEVDITTRYACQNWTTTAPPPEDECIWNVGNNRLNLTLIQGFVLNTVSDHDPSQIYSISPCSNNINCNDDDSMMTVSTLSTCIQTIARWDQGDTAPAYSDNFGGQWQFVYTNGDSCNNGAESVVTVFWFCNPFAGTARITAAKEIGICNFEVQIDSNLACS